MENIYDKFKQPDTETSSSGKKKHQLVDFAAGKLPGNRGLQELLPERTTIVHRQRLVSPNADWYRPSEAEALQDKYAIAETVQEVNESRTRGRIRKKIF